jgi:hypothetical protein
LLLFSWKYTETVCWSFASILCQRQDWWNYTPLSHTSSWCGTYLIKQRNNFSFTFTFTLWLSQCKLGLKEVNIVKLSRQKLSCILVKTLLFESVSWFFCSETLLSYVVSVQKIEVWAVTAMEITELVKLNNITYKFF